MSAISGYHFGLSDQWLNMPAASTEFLGLATRRRRLDLRGSNLARLVTHVSVVGTATSTLRVQYTTDLTGATGWATLTPTVSLAALGTVTSQWGYIPDAAKTEVLVRIIGINGDGAIDPTVNMTELQIW